MSLDNRLVRNNSGSFGRRLMFGLLGLGLTFGAVTVHAGESMKPAFQSQQGATSAVVLQSSVGSRANMFYSFVGKKVLVRLLNVKDRDWIGQCLAEDDDSITVQINNNVYQFFFSEIEYVEAL